MAGRRPHRGAVRDQLRGGRRELPAPRRPGLGGVPVGDRRRAGLAGPAPHEHGIDLRIRLAGRLLAPAQAVHRAQPAGDGLRRRHRPPAQSRRGRRHARGRLGDRLPRPQVDRLPRLLLRGGEGPHERGDPDPHRGDRRAPARLVHGPDLGKYPAAGDGRGRLPLLGGFLRRRPALLGRGAARTATGGALHPRFQRHAVRDAARLQCGDQFFAYLRDSFDVLYAEGAETPRMLSIGLHCRLVGRPGRIAAWPASSTTSPPTTTCG